MPFEPKNKALLSFDDYMAHCLSRTKDLIVDKDATDLTLLNINGKALHAYQSDVVVNKITAS